MTDIAAQARAAAFNFEGKKDGLYQKKGDDWVVRFTLQASELCDALREAPLGTRYQLALVEIGDDELPIDRNDTQPRPDNTVSASSSVPAGAKRKFEDMLPAQQAGMLCADEAFQRFLQENYRNTWRDTSLADDPHDVRAARAVRAICGVNSRKNITEDNVIWYGLVHNFRLWQRHPELSAV